MSRKTPNPTHAQELVTLRTGRDLATLLTELYIDQRRSHGDIAEQLRVSRNTVAMWLREFGIVRADVEAQA